MNGMPTGGALARFQDAFAQALRAPDIRAPEEIAALVAQPAFAVYRNTVIKGCVDALQANYPAVARLVGEEWFRAAAGVYAHASLPGGPALLEYGADFPDFLARFEPAAALPYLPGVARLDRYWTEAHIARDEPVLDAAAFGQFTPEALAGTLARPHAAARWAWFDAAPVYTIWSRNRDPEDFDGDIPWGAEGALLTRPRDAVVWRPLDAAGCAFLDACAAGRTLATAALAALEARASIDLAQLLAGLIESGAINRIDTVAGAVQLEESA
jgi:hypothetical protein